MDDYCYCDNDPPSVMRKEQRKAKKEHRCCECGRTIRSGETYEYVWGVWDGSAGTYKTCSHCVALRDYTTAHVPCFCWYYGGMRIEAIEMLREYAHEAPGLFFAGARLYVQAKRMRGADIRATKEHIHG
jgi:hypothetical protein